MSPGAGSSGRVSPRLVLALFALALLARLPNLDAGLWYDEIWFVVEYLRLPFGELVRTYDSDNIHPLYALLAWPSVRVFGEEPWAARLPALLFGAAGVPLVYVFGARGGNARAGLLAALLLAFAPHAVAFSQSARGYTALLAFTLLAGVGLREACRTGSAGAVLLLGAGLGLATHAHLTGVFLAPALIAVWLVELGGGRIGSPRARFAPLHGVVLGGVFSLALHAPILRDMLAFFTREKDDFAATVSTWKSPVWMVREIAQSFGVGEVAGLSILAVGALVLISGFAAAWRRDRVLALVSVLPAVFGQGTMWLLGRNLWPRFFFSLAGFWLLLAVLGTDGLLAQAFRERGRRAANVAVALGVLLFAVLSLRVWRLPKQDFAGAVAWIEERRGPEVAVMSAGQAMYPLRDFFETDYAIVEEPEAIDAALAGKERGYVIVTSANFTQGYYPEVWTALLERGREVARFPAQSFDQHVVVLELTP